jgi:flagellar protein FlaI
MKKKGDVKSWLEEAIHKGYSDKGIRELLVRKGYSHGDILKVLSFHENIKDKIMPSPPKPTREEFKPRVPDQKIQVQKSDIIQEPLIPQITMPKPKGKAIEAYSLEIDKAKVEIRIEKTDQGIAYDLYLPEVDLGTRALLDEIRKDLIAITAIAVGEIIDQKSVRKIKIRFMHDAGRLLREKIPTISKESEEFLIGVLMQEMLGLGKIEFLLNDPNLEEIVIVTSKEIRVYHKNHGWLATNVKLKTEDEVTNYANIIARRVGRQISILNPLLDAHVVTGDRANAVLYPIATKGNTITIRKFSRDPWTIIDLINNKTLCKDIAAILWLAIEYEMNILFSGGTASGKTVCLNACMPFIPSNHRVISMEDTRELMLPKFLYWCPLVTRTANREGKGEVSMLDLLVNSLRMRPDRIILGEIRRQKEAEVLFEAMHTGHSVYSTVHADTASETIRRLTNPPISVPP